MFLKRLKPFSKNQPDNADSLHVNLSLSLAEAYGGTERQLLVSRYVRCSCCADGGDRPLFARRRAKVCPICAGECRVIKESLLNFDLAPMDLNREEQRFAGEGHVRQGGQSAGDLVLHLKVLPHPRFQADGTMLTGSVQVSARLAGDGGITEADILGVPVRISIPPGTLSGSWLTLDGHGMPDLNATEGGRGPLRLRIDVISLEDPEPASGKPDQNSAEQLLADAVPLSSLPAESTAQRLLEDCWNRVKAMPEVSPCMCCGKDTSGLVVQPVQHRLFSSGVPLSVCSTCVGRFPVADKNSRLIPPQLTDPFIERPANAVFCWAAGIWILQQASIQRDLPLVPWLLCGGLLLPILMIFGLRRLDRLWSQRRTEKRRARLRKMLQTVGLQSVFADDPEAFVMLLSPVRQFQRPTDSPPELFREWLVLHQQFQPYFGESLRQRAGLCREILETLVKQVLQQQQQVLNEAPAGAVEAISVGLVLLPDCRMDAVVQIYSSGRGVAELQAALRSSILQLPQIHVSYALPMQLYSCNRAGVALNPLQLQPFKSWSKAPGTEDLPAGTSLADLAERIYDVRSEVRDFMLGAEDIRAWVRRGASLLEILSAECARMVENYLQSPFEIEWQEQVSLLLTWFSESDPDVPEIRFLHARCLGQMDLPERAAAVCQELLRSFPTFANAHGLLACLQHHLGRSQDAEETLRSAPRGGLSIEFYLSVARLFRDLNQLSRASGYLHAAVFRYPCQPQPWLERAQLLAAMGLYERAIQDLDRYESLARADLQTVWFRGQWLTAIGRHNAALDLYERAAEQEPNNPVFLQLRAEVLDEVGRSSEAVAETARVLQQAPDFLPARMLHIHSLIAEGSLSEALDAIDSLPDDDALTGERHMLRGLVLQQRGELEEALWQFDRACAADDRPQLRCRRVEVLWSLERFDEALTDLNEVLADLPDAVPLLVLRGRVLVQLRRPHEAAIDFDRVLQIDAQNVDALHGRAVVFIDDQQLELAMNLLDAALRIAPDEPNSLLARARLLWDERELRLAEADLSKLLTKSPNFIPAIMFRAEIRLRQRRFEDAKSDLDHAIQDDPENSVALLSRSLVHEHLGNPEEARSDFTRAAELSPDSQERLTVNRLLLQASLSFEDEHYADAIQFVEEVLTLQPENPHALRCRAAAHWYLDQFVEALHDYDLLLELPEIPDQPRAGLLISRGAVLGELGEFEQALDILLPAVTEARQTRGRDLARGLNALARALTGLERFTEAHEAFIESLSMEPENAWLHFNRGLYLLAQGQRQAAGKCFSLAHNLKRPPLSPRKRLQAAAFIRQLNAVTPSGFNG